MILFFEAKESSPGSLRPSLGSADFPDMGSSLNSLRGGIEGTTIGVIKGILGV